jgi:RND family efflux transporter MFP subunit
MNSENETRGGTKEKKGIVRRFWGIMPSLFLILLIVVFALLFSKIKSESDVIKKERAAALKKNNQSVNVIVLKLVPSTLSDRINFPGKVDPWVKLKILAEVRGKIVKKTVKEGEPVTKGDTLAVIDSRDYINAWRSAKASYRAAEASFKRIEKLYEQQLATRNQFDDAMAQLEQTESAMDNAALSLGRCTIKAPISGVVNQLSFELGQYLNVADPVAEILQIDRVKVQVGIPESDVAAVRNLSNFDVRIDALGGRVYRAKKYFLSKTADSMARLYNLQLMLDNPDQEILPDMFVRVDIVKKAIADSLSVPLYAVMTKGKKQMVFVEQGGVAHGRIIETGFQEGWQVEVTKGLRAGESVIVVGHRHVNDGQKVNVVRKVTNPEGITL